VLIGIRVLRLKANHPVRESCSNAIPRGAADAAGALRIHAESRGTLQPEIAIAIRLRVLQPGPPTSRKAAAACV